MKKTALLLLTLAVLSLLAACTANTAENSSLFHSDSGSRTETTVSTLNPAPTSAVTSTQSSAVFTSDNFKVAKNAAVEAAFAAAKAKADDYNLQLLEQHKHHYTCELREQNGEQFYDIIFKEIPLKGATDFKTQIGVWVNTQTGKVLKVIQYK